jgi:hypothetical protein
MLRFVSKQRHAVSLCGVVTVPSSRQLRGYADEQENPTDGA